MSRYIKLEDAINGKCPVEDIWEDCINCPLDNNGIEPCKMGKWLKSLPTIDIVHCGECKHNENTCINHGEMSPRCRYVNYKRSADDFCSYGERIDNE